MAQLYWRVKRDGKWVLQAVLLHHYLYSSYPKPECECLKCSNKGVEAFE